MNEEKTIEPKPDETAEAKPEKEQVIGSGIVGNSTNHDLAMTRLWVSGNIIENVEIRIIGSDWIKKQAEQLTEQIKGKTISDVEFLVDFNPDDVPDLESLNLNIIYESIIKALADLRKSPEKPEQAEPVGETPIVESPPVENPPEEKPVGEEGQ
jgi:NifU-like protein involved in Fe-S cluster formation